MSDYQAGELGGRYLYPKAGDPEPRKGAKVSLLTNGGIHTTGPWDPSYCVAWLHLPKRDKEKEMQIALHKP